MSDTQNLIDATLPLSPQNQIKFFKDKSLVFNIDMENSRLTTKQCFLTLSNMKIKSRIKDVDVDIMKEYMTVSHMVNTTNLAKICANIITGYKFGEMYYTDVQDDFTIDQYARFIVDNHPMIEQWCEVIRSIPLFLMLNCNNFLEEKSVENLYKGIKRVEGKVDGVGLNISQVIALPDFLKLFFSHCELRHMLTMPYYNYYFDDSVYGGDKLIHFLASKEHQSEFAVECLGMMKCIKDGNFDVIEDADDQEEPVQEDE